MQPVLRAKATDVINKLKINGEVVSVDFIGKKGVKNTGKCRSKRLSRNIRIKKKTLNKNESIFTYKKGNKWYLLKSSDVNKYLKKFDGFIALGCVIKGKTPHFDFISQSSTNAIMNLSINSKKPIGNGILTCLNLNQAKIRKKKGAEAAKAIISVLSQK